jgi:hypothetical protein
MNPPNNSFEYTIPKKESQPAGQVYLGTFLAFSLFFSFFFGNLLFFLIVLIICVFIFLEREVEIGDEKGNIHVGFFPDGFLYGKKFHPYSEVLSFTMHTEIFGDEEKYLRITFKSPGKQDLFISVPESVQNKTIYDIIRRSVREDNKKEISLTDAIVLRFF